MTREVLTLQFGNYSNYIGAHFWNTQEFSFNYDAASGPSELDNDVLYREGLNSAGQTTYTPRLLLVDVEGSLRHLPRSGYLYDDKLDYASASVMKNDDSMKKAIAWETDDIEVITEDPIERPQFQKDIDDSQANFQDKNYNWSQNVSSWTDYLYTRFHPRTIEIIKDCKHSNDIDSFDTYCSGISLWNSNTFETDFCEKIRQIIEECDNCQGFQTIFDCANGFSGITIKCLEHLNDNYGKTNFTVPVFAPKRKLFESADFVTTDSICVANIALAYSNLIEQSSLFVPLSITERSWRQSGEIRKFPLIEIDNYNTYQTSAVLSVYLETITSLYRMRSPGSSNFLSGICSDIGNYGRKLAAAALAFPIKMNSDQDLIDCLNEYDTNLFTQISPNTNIGTDYIVQSVCSRGIPKNRLKRPLKDAQKQQKMAAYKCETISEMLQLYFQCNNHASLTHVSATTSPLPIKAPFPQEIFSSQLNFEGFVSTKERMPGDKINSSPAIAAIQSSSDLIETIGSLHHEAGRIKISKLHRFRETDMEQDEYSEALEQLLQFKDNYKDSLDL